VLLVILEYIFYGCAVHGDKEEKVAPFVEFDDAIVVGVYGVEEGVED